MALYNNGFPVTYPQMYPAYTPVQQQQTAPQQGGLIWVSGEAGAKAYLVAPNTTVQLWDSESQTVYLKSADASGMPSMKILDYTFREMGQNGANKPVQNQDRQIPVYATKDDLRAVSDQLEALRSRVDSIKRMEVSENE